MVIRIALFLLLAGTCLAVTRSPSHRIPPQLVPVSQTPLKNARDVAFSEDAVFVAQNFVGMTALDIRDPASPKTICSIAAEKAQPLALEMLRPGVMLEADRFRGLVVWDVSKPHNPVILGQAPVPGIATQVQGFESRGRPYAALACGAEGVVIAELNDLTRPAVVGRFNTDRDYTKDLAVSGSLLFSADNTQGGLKVIDIGRPAAPQLLLKIQMNGFCDALTVEKDLLIGNYRTRGTRLFHIDRKPAVDDLESTPAITYLCGVFRGSEYSRKAALLDSWMIVANDVTGVELYDLHLPAIPVLVSEYRTPDAAISCAVYRGFIYIPCWDAGLIVMRISDL